MLAPPPPLSSALSTQERDKGQRETHTVSPWNAAGAQQVRPPCEVKAMTKDQGTTVVRQTVCLTGAKDSVRCISEMKAEESPVWKAS